MGTPLEIYCDFDGTVTCVDSVDVLLEELADPSWREIESAWERGEIGSRECMARQIALLRGGWPAVEKALSLVAIDPSFAEFVRWCRDNEVALKLVSDGLDRSIEHILERDGVRVDAIVANRLVELPEDKLSLEFPYVAPGGDCGSGVCKCLVLENGSAAKVRVFIGDGRSDFCCAASPDLLFAKSKLLKHCQDNGIASIPFADFHDVRRELQRRFSLPAPEKNAACSAGQVG